MIKGVNANEVFRVCAYTENLFLMLAGLLDLVQISTSSIPLVPPKSNNPHRSRPVDSHYVSFAISHSSGSESAIILYVILHTQHKKKL